MSYQLAQAIQTDDRGFVLPPAENAAPAQPYVPPAETATETAAPAQTIDPIPHQEVNSIVLVMIIAVVVVFFSVHIGVEVGRSKRYWSGPVWGIIAFCVQLMMLPTALGFAGWLGLPPDVIAQWGWARWIAAILTVSVICWITMQLVVKILPDDPPANIRRQQ